MLLLRKGKEPGASPTREDQPSANASGSAKEFVQASKCKLRLPLALAASPRVEYPLEYPGNSRHYNIYAAIGFLSVPEPFHVEIPLLSFQPLDPEVVR
jgi:hypothetical protein